MHCLASIVVNSTLPSTLDGDGLVEEESNGYNGGGNDNASETNNGEDDVDTSSMGNATGE